MNAQAPRTDICCICFGNAVARGGEFLVTPGCCGKWFHQSCIVQLRSAGKSECPHCRTPFPADDVKITPNAILPLPPPSTVISPAPAVAAPVESPLRRTLWSWTSMNRSTPANKNVSRPVVSSSSAGPSSSAMEEDPAATLSTAAEPPERNDFSLEISITPEYPVISTEEVEPFYARVNTRFHDCTSRNRQPLDVVCILDNSGSMAGQKILFLKRAMQFVLSVLGDQDRLAIVTFNSRATALHGLKRLNDRNKRISSAAIESIRAGGGTDIYAGLHVGWSFLENRHTSSAASCVFLLTDGQDRCNLPAKLNLAKAMREAGSSLFLFGFGADHDSEHMNEIANAAEGSFIYIETPDSVVDAFGGAIGTQQGTILRDVTVHLTTFPDIIIDGVMAGRYPSRSTANSAVITFADLYSGEQRDVLIRLRIPAISNPVEEFRLLVSTVNYHISGQAERVVVGGGSCSIKRVDSRLLGDACPKRDLGVDSQLLRIRCTEAMQSALEVADGGNIAVAREALEKIRAELLESVSYGEQEPVAVELLREVDQALEKLQSRDIYEREGGRAMIQESYTSYCRQRSAYARTSNIYQNEASVMMQGKAKAAKGWSF